MPVLQIYFLFEFPRALSWGSCFSRYSTAPSCACENNTGSWLVRLRLYFHNSNRLVPRWAPVGHYSRGSCGHSTVAPIGSISSWRGGGQGQPFSPRNLHIQARYFISWSLACLAISQSRKTFIWLPSIPPWWHYTIFLKLCLYSKYISLWVPPSLELGELLFALFNAPLRACEKTTREVD